LEAFSNNTVKKLANPDEQAAKKTKDLVQYEEVVTFRNLEEFVHNKCKFM
jgi:hypothetical protein